jgi:hypothetical protein
MWRKFIRFILISSVLCMGIVLTGCATIVTSGSQEVTFNSQPDGATVSVNGKVIGKTPITTRLDRKSGQAMVFEKDGYKSQTMRLETTINGWFWGNIVIGGFLGSTTDGVSGAVHQYSPSQYFVTLQPTGPVDGQTLKRTKAKDYIVLNYNNIAKDISQGSGEYVNALWAALEVEQKNQAEALAKLKSLIDIYQKDITAFADSVIALYVK